MNFVGSSGRMFSDAQRRAMFASMFSKSPIEVKMAKAPLAIADADEQFSPVGNNLAYNGVMLLNDGTTRRVFEANLFALPIATLEKYTRLRGSDLAAVAEDIIIAKTDEKYIASDQIYLDIGDMPSLKDLGLAKAFEGEVLEYVSEPVKELNPTVEYDEDGNPLVVYDDYDIKNWADVNQFHDDVYETAKEGPKVITTERVIEKEIEREVPVVEEITIVGGVGDNDYYGQADHKSHLEMAGMELPVVDDSVSFEQRGVPVEVVMEEVPPDTSIQDRMVGYFETEADRLLFRDVENIGIPRDVFLDNVSQYKAEQIAKTQKADRDRVDLENERLRMVEGIRADARVAVAGVAAEARKKVAITKATADIATKVGRG